MTNDVPLTAGKIIVAYYWSFVLYDIIFYWHYKLLHFYRLLTCISRCSSVVKHGLIGSAFFDTPFTLAVTLLLLSLLLSTTFPLPFTSGGGAITGGGGGKSSAFLHFSRNSLSCRTNPMFGCMMGRRAFTYWNASSKLSL